MGKVFLPVIVEISDVSSDQTPPDFYPPTLPVAPPGTVGPHYQKIPYYHRPNYDDELGVLINLYVCDDLDRVVLSRND